MSDVNTITAAFVCVSLNVSLVFPKRLFIAYTLIPFTWNRCHTLFTNTVIHPGIKCTRTVQFIYMYMCSESILA